MFRTLIAAAVLLWASVVRADIESALDAVVKVKSGDGGTGTGTVFLVDNAGVHILTNAHVATTKDVNVLFYRQGYESPPIPGTTAWRAPGMSGDPGTDNDLAVVVVQRDRLGYTPPAMAIAPLSAAAKSGESMITVGCPKGLWPQLFRGHIVSKATGSQSPLTFYPPPLGGRSGSAIYDRECKHIVGVLAWIIGDGGKSVGGAVSLENVIKHLSGSAAYRNHVKGLIDAPYSRGVGTVPADIKTSNESEDGWKPVDS